MNPNLGRQLPLSCWNNILMGRPLLHAHSRLTKYVPSEQESIYEECFIPMDNFEISHWVDSVLHMHHICVLKGSADMENAVHCCDMREEAVTQPLAVGRSPAKSTWRCIHLTCRQSYHTLDCAVCASSDHRSRQNIRAPLIIRRGLPDKPRNVHNFQECRDLALWLVDITEPLEAVIRDIHSRLQN